MAVADDHHLFRKGFISLLREFDNIDIVGEAQNGKELLTLIRNERVDVALLDLEMPVMDGVEATVHITKKFPLVKVLVLTMHNDEGIIIDMVEKGASGFLLKNYDIERVADALHAVTENGFYFPEDISKRLVHGLMLGKKAKRILADTNLSERELHILNLICREYTSNEIAEQLCISTRTVEGHRDRLLEKTGARNTAGLVIYAIKNKLFEL